MARGQRAPPGGSVSEGGGREGGESMLETILEFPPAHAPALRRELVRCGWREGVAWWVTHAARGNLLVLRVRADRPCADLVIRDARRILAPGAR